MLTVSLKPNHLLSNEMASRYVNYIPLIIYLDSQISAQRKRTGYFVVAFVRA